MGTLERIGLDNSVLLSQRQLIDASGNNMNIGVYSEVNIRIGKNQYPPYYASSQLENI